MSGILTDEELDHWYRWRDHPSEYGAYISAIDVRALVDHIEAVGRHLVEIADVITRTPVLSERYGPVNPGKTAAEQNAFSAGVLYQHDKTLAIYRIAADVTGSAADE